MPNDRARIERHLADLDLGHHARSKDQVQHGSGENANQDSEARIDANAEVVAVGSDGTRSHRNRD